MMSDDSDESQPKLVDFGLSRILHPGETTTESFGTLRYAAPEVITEKPYSFSCDMWSLGCLIYAMLSGNGKTPFVDPKGDAQEEVRRILEDKV